ncbi:MAG: hypothetical protein J1F18_00310 [Lachnospiraceae bacterium]|nr:hypothetical protein [Lachnospiraceae bacterium]
MSYKYITDNNLYEKQNYMYSEFGGTVFLMDYINSREKYLHNGEHRDIVVTEYHCATGQGLQRILNKLKSGHVEDKTIDLINSYTKSFEVRKRIYTNYDNDFKPLEDAGFEDYDNYLLFAECLLLVYRQTGCLKYFSCLLKVDDTLLSVWEKLQEYQKEYMSRIIRHELKCFYQLVDENKIYMGVET